MAKITVNGVKTQSYNHGAQGIAFDVNGLTNRQAQKLYNGLCKIFNTVNTSNIKVSFNDSMIGYILVK